MNILVFFSIIILTLVRLIGLGVSLILFLETKSTKFKIFIPGWGLWSISAFFPIISETIENKFVSEALLVLSTILLLLGMFFIIIGIISYFTHIFQKLVISLALLIITIPLVLFFTIGINFAINFTSIMFFFLFIFIFVSVWLARENVKNVLGNSIHWLYITLIFSFFYLVNGFITALQGYSFGLYTTDNVDVIIRYYFFVIGITMLIAILQIHIEQSVSYLHKFQLKDKYSHNLGNIMQIILNTIEIEAELINVELIKEKCLEAGEHIKEIREL